jgi:hypothetical protein
LGIYTDKAIKGGTVTEVLDKLMTSRGLPQGINSCPLIQKQAKGLPHPTGCNNDIPKLC